jgi:cAMP-binding proteins - catabolite gene activator and regulatory subunit of cAMP-dependent protein kinases
MAETKSIANYVKRHKLERILSPELIRELKLRGYGRGERIIASGSPVDGLYFFVDGRAKVYSQMENGSSLLVRFYSPFDILGDVELFSRTSFLLNADAIEGATCLFLDKREIVKHSERNAALLQELCARLGRKLAEFNASAAINLRYPVANRLASYLVAVECEEDCKTLGTDDLGELADLLGASYRQLSRVLRDFKDSGILEERRGAVRVLDRARLEKLARDTYR